MPGLFFLPFQLRKGRYYQNFAKNGEDTEKISKKNEKIWIYPLNRYKSIDIIYEANMWPVKVLTA